MTCDLCREALSARLDGESEPGAAVSVDEHLCWCARCREWLTDAIDLTRTVRVRSVIETPDLVASVMALAPAMPDRRQRLRAVLETQWPRYALGVVAAAQVLLGIAQMCGVDFGMLSHGQAMTSSMPGMSGAAMTAHLFNESTAWVLAVGIGLLWVVWRPRSAGGLLPLLSVFVVVLSGFVIHDLMMDRVTISRVASHGLLVVALALLVVVHRRFGRSGIPTPGNVAVPDWSGVTGSAELDRYIEKVDRSDGPPLRPAGRHVA